MTWDSTLEGLKSRFVFEPSDVEFARMLERLCGPCDEKALVAAALAFRAPRLSDVCVDLERLRDVYVYETGERCPLPGGLLEAVKEAPFVGKAESPDGIHYPLVLFQNRLYLQRYYLEEQRLARAVLRRMEARSNLRLEEGEGFDGPLKEALLVLEKRPLLILSGGPGTGKTTLGARLLCLLARAGLDPEGFFLLAPTGRAAVRLSEVLREEVEKWGLSEELKERLRISGSTLHSALGIHPDRPFYAARNKDNPLQATAVVVDEASMVDLTTMTRLFEAVPEEVPLILIGDPNQLASVQAGAVLSDLSEAQEVKEAIVRLEQVHRYSEVIGEGARLVAEGKAEEFEKWLRSPHAEVEYTDISRGNWRRDLIDEACKSYADVVELAKRGDGAEALKKARSFRVLCAVRRGPTGCETINSLIAQRILGDEDVSPGLLLMVTQNDPETGLCNGDLGVVVAGLLAAFETPKEGLRLFPLSRLPPWEPAFAVTIHKSQGGQAENIVVVLTQGESPILSRELLYTAITRAQKHVHIYATPESLQKSVKSRLQRASGLREALGRGGR